MWTNLIIETAHRKRLHPSCSIIPAEKKLKRPPGALKQSSAFIRREGGRGRSKERWGRKRARDEVEERKPEKK